MKRTALFVLAFLAALPLWAGKIVTATLQSRVLGAPVDYNVYLPDDYGEENRSYPVVYLLHGLSDDYSAWAQKGGLQVVADELIRSGEAVPMVIVMPNAGGADIHNVWNGYFNMPGWSYEDFFFGEFLPEIEKQYNCGGGKDRRAIMGLSMGGGGSVVYSQRHPDLFSSCYALSPWLDNQDNEVSDGSQNRDKFYLVKEAVKQHSALTFLEKADAATLERLRTVAWFVDCGDDDFILHLSLAFHLKMKQAGVHNELRVRDGVHNWEYWHLGLRTALPFASRNFSR